MTEHHLLSPYNWICGIFSKFVMVNSNDKKEWAGERSSTLSLVTFPFFSRYASSNCLRFQYLVVPYLLVARLFWAVCLPGLWPLSQVSFSLPCLGAFFLLFLTLFWVLSFYKVWQGFITIGVSGLYIYIFEIFEFVGFFLFVIVNSNDKKESSIMTCTLKGIKHHDVYTQRNQVSWRVHS